MKNLLFSLIIAVNCFACPTVSHATPNTIDSLCSPAPQSVGQVAFFNNSGSPRWLFYYLADAGSSTNFCSVASAIEIPIGGYRIISIPSNKTLFYNAFSTPSCDFNNRVLSGSPMTVANCPQNISIH